MSFYGIGQSFIQLRPIFLHFRKSSFCCLPEDCEQSVFQRKDLKIRRKLHRLVRMIWARWRRAYRRLVFDKLNPTPRVIFGWQIVRMRKSFSDIAVFTSWQTMWRMMWLLSSSIVRRFRNISSTGKRIKAFFPPDGNYLVDIPMARSHWHTSR